MNATIPATEVLLRINLNRGLSESEIALLADDAKASGGLDQAVLGAIRRGIVKPRKRTTGKRAASSSNSPSR